VPFDADKCVNKPQHQLPKYALQEWMGLLFINLSAQPSDLSAELEKINPFLQHYKMERFTQAYSSGVERWHSNWKLAVENGIESYHLFMVHRDTLELNTPSKKAYYVAGNSDWTLTGGEIVSQQSRLSTWFTGSTPEPLNQYMLIFLPPGFIGILTYDSFDWVAVLPDGPEHCTVHVGGMAESAPGKGDAASLDFTAQFLQEDRHICERVQDGMKSRHHKSAVVNSKTKVATDRSSKPQPTRNLNLTIKGTRNQRGQIIVQIYDDPKAFNTLQYDQALHTLVVPLKGFNGHINFADLTPGSYAVSLMHDENQNQLFDTQGNFLEGYAYSNNVGKTKTATFAQAQFDIKQVNKKLVLNMIYH